jgi:S-adenosylmethionine:tRNA ribosyltransferase-isomerase
MGRNGNASVEMMLHERLGEKRWEVLVKPGKKARVGDTIQFGEPSGEPSAQNTGGDGKISHLIPLLTAHVEAITAEGLRVVSLDYDGPFDSLLEKIGEPPLPHYITEKPKNPEERARYQTVYARHDGSVAAPTAGLHFTDDILRQLSETGVRFAKVTLHVGLGTFRPVKTDRIADHVMHSEYCRIEPDQAEIINETKKNGGKIIAVGTTACRTLESRADESGFVIPGEGRTDIFIYPGYTFKVIDGLLTNFHLPESTLIMLVSAFAGRDTVLAASREAIRAEYRCFSYGDCMLIV